MLAQNGIGKIGDPPSIIQAALPVPDCRPSYGHIGSSSINPTWQVVIGGSHLGHMVNHLSKTYFLFGDSFAGEASGDAQSDCEVRQAPAPWGPWSRPVRAADFSRAPGLYPLNPQFIEDKGRALYLTMSLGNPNDVYLAGVALDIAPGDGGDFNGESKLYGADLARWRGDFGKNAINDADEDGDSDGDELLLWQRQPGADQIRARAAKLSRGSPCLTLGELAGAAVPDADVRRMALLATGYSLRASRQRPLRRVTW